MAIDENPDGAPVFLSSDRLASLSDTMFGVAMTLVVTTLLPSIQAQRDLPFALLPDLLVRLISVLFSFMVAARYWISQQQRLAMTRSITAGQTWLHLAFLLLIILVPISTSLPRLAGPGAIKSSAVIYGAHLALIALVNLLLWIEVHRRAAAHVHIIRAALALGCFVVALGVAIVRPELAIMFWLGALATPRLGQYLARRWYGKSTAAAVVSGTPP